MKVLIVILALVCFVAAQNGPAPGPHAGNCENMVEYTRKFHSVLPSNFIQQAIATLETIGVPKVAATNFYENLFFNKNASAALVCKEYKMFQRSAMREGFKKSCPTLLSTVKMMREYVGKFLTMEQVMEAVNKQLNALFAHVKDDGLLNQARDLLLNNVLSAEVVCSKLADLYLDAFEDKTVDSLSDIDFANIRRWILQSLKRKKAQKTQVESDKTLPYIPRCYCIRAPCPCDKLPNYQRVELFDDEMADKFNWDKISGYIQKGRDIYDLIKKRDEEDDEEADAEFFKKLGGWFKKNFTPENIEKGLNIYRTVKGGDDIEGEEF